MTKKEFLPLIIVVIVLICIGVVIFLLTGKDKWTKCANGVMHDKKHCGKSDYCGFGCFDPMTTCTGQGQCPGGPLGWCNICPGDTKGCCGIDGS